jgi:hypothetical protein
VFHDAEVCAKIIEKFAAECTFGANLRSLESERFASIDDIVLIDVEVPPALLRRKMVGDSEQPRR